MSGNKPTRVGELRPSQVLYTFGVGASGDLPNMAVMVKGLESWPRNDCSEVHEARLLRAVRSRFPTVEQLLMPPLPHEEPKDPFDANARVGMPVKMFPRWLRCPRCNHMAPVSSGLFQLKPNPYRPDLTRWVHTGCNALPPGSKSPPTVVPVRFVVACENGHLEDFPWVEFVHNGPTECKSVLQMYQLGASDSVTDVIVKCITCDAKKAMAEAFDPARKEAVLPLCKGHHPHIESTGDCRDEDGERLRMQAMLLGASNSWFSLNLSVLSVPASSANRLAQLVDDHWSVLKAATSKEVLQAFRAIGQLRALEEYSDGEIWDAIRAQTDGNADEEPLDIKEPEWEAFSSPDENRNNRDFRLESMPPPPGFEGWFDKVVLVHRLREVRALVGFTRIQSPGEFGEEWEVPPRRRAPLSAEKLEWVPTVEVRGEGIFLQFDENRLRKWENRADVRALEEDFFQAHKQWRMARRLPDSDHGFPGIRYILLHSFAHVLMRQLSLACGYNAASIRERIYSRAPGQASDPMAGVLIYTAATDSEGTLGGLVAQGRPETLAYHLEQALEEAALCTADPLCAEHHPYDQGVTLHGAACHACLFAPETSCERGNKYLDRKVLIATLQSADAATSYFES